MLRYNRADGPRHPPSWPEGRESLWRTRPGQRHNVQMTGVVGPVIRTPDQRIRVFVSSTLRELSEERRAVRTAIESLRLAPVMFELGARPHPPRALYRSYLEQSDVFVGIYGDSYGWVAPMRRSPVSRTSTGSRRRGCPSSSTSAGRGSVTSD
jgi:hypothetical protein